MQSLEEHNNEVLNNMYKLGDPHKNNIACPECGEELWDTNPSLCLTSYPPQYAVHCDCGYTGYRR